MSNRGRLKLHPLVDEQKSFAYFPIRQTEGTSQFNFPARSNVYASNPSISGQVYLVFIFRFFSEANLSIVTISHRLTVNSSNASGVTSQLPKTMVLLNLSVIFSKNFLLFYFWFISQSGQVAVLKGPPLWKKIRKSLKHLSLELKFIPKKELGNRSYGCISRRRNPTCLMEKELKIRKVSKLLLIFTFTFCVCRTFNTKRSELLLQEK